MGINKKIKFKIVLLRILAIFLILAAITCFVFGILSFEERDIPEMPFLLPIGIFIMFGGFVLLGISIIKSKQKIIEKKMNDFKEEQLAKNFDDETYINLNNSNVVEGVTGNTCAKCGFINPSDAKFCNKCGATLTKKCPYCGAENDDGARYCKTCGKNID